MNEIQRGTVLLAEPFMREGSFKRSAILLCDYSEDEGSVGYILNKPMNLQMEDVIQDFPEFDGHVYYGGPVSGDTLHYIHMKGDIIEESREVAPGIFWGGDFDQVKFLIKTQVLRADEINFFLGYAGWSAGQLEDEIEYGSWILSQIDRNYLFGQTKKGLWKKIMKNKGDHYTVISNMPDGSYQN